MINRSTIEKLIEMKLVGMADAFRHQLSDPHMNDVAFEDRFGMMVDIEYTRRKNNRLDRLIKNAEFDQADANIRMVQITKPQLDKWFRAARQAHLFRLYQKALNGT